MATPIYIASSGSLTLPPSRKGWIVIGKNLLMLSNRNLKKEAKISKTLKRFPFCVRQGNKH